MERSRIIREICGQWEPSSASHFQPGTRNSKLETNMPYVNIKVTDDGVTPEQKADLIKGVTELLQKVLNKNPETTVVVIDEVSTDNWGIGGQSVTVRRKK